MKYLAIAAIPLMAASLSTQAVTTDQVSKQIQKLNQRIAASEQRFRINGFASFGITMSDEEFAYNGINDDVNFRRNTKAGIQMSFALDNKTSVVTQMVSRGTNDFKTNMEWAYLKHQISSSLTAKVGRIRSPFYMLSEYLDVGYAVPWATMPAETYQSLNLFSNMDGIDLTYSIDIGDMTGTAQFAYGRVDTESFELEDVISAGFTLAGDDWQTRFAYSQADAISELGGVALYGDDTNVAGSFASLGATYDPGDLYLAAETTLLEVDGSLADATSSYGTIGYRIGAWMPHISYAVTESTDDEERTLQAAADALTGGSLVTLAAVGSVEPAEAVSATNPSLASAATVYKNSLNRNTQRIGIGARWDYSSGVAMKFQYDIITTDDAPGLFGSTTEDATAYTQAGAAAPDKTNIISFTIDTVF